MGAADRFIRDLCLAAGGGVVLMAEAAETFIKG